MKTENSKALFEAAQQLMPGGVNSPARAFGAVGNHPVIIDRAEGAHLHDVDGNQYLDYIGSWGPMILGHCHPAVKTALHEAVDRGTSYGAPTCAENTLAELIIEAVPSVDKVRLVNSGTEATMSAIRLARGYTGRDLIIKFSGNYHGHVDSLLVAAGSSAATLSVPNSPGVTAGTSQDTLILEYNDCQQVVDAFSQHGNQIAAVIMEPVVGNMGCVIPSASFLETVRRETASHDALLIFDEVMTGFRVALGGAQQLFGITPDLTTLGKIVGGGMPIGAYGGRREIMDHVLPVGEVFQAGTLSGNPLATAAGIATLQTLKTEDPYSQLDQRGQQLAEGLTAAANAAGLPAHVQRVGSMLTLFFHDEPIHSWQQASKCNTEQFARFFWGMLQRGSYWPCSQYEALFVSTCHTTADIDTTIAAAHEALAEL